MTLWFDHFRWAMFGVGIGFLVGGFVYAKAVE